jgi:hypothetical protein
VGWLLTGEAFARGLTVAPGGQGLGPFRIPALDRRQDGLGIVPCRRARIRAPKERAIARAVWCQCLPANSAMSGLPEAASTASWKRMSASIMPPTPSAAKALRLAAISDGSTRWPDSAACFAANPSSTAPTW